MKFGRASVAPAIAAVAPTVAAADAAGKRGGRSGGSDINASERNFPGERYVVCVRYNAKGLDGHYTGVKPGMAVYAGGRFNDFTEHPKGTCDQAEFKPFPELEKLSR